MKNLKTYLNPKQLAERWGTSPSTISTNVTRCPQNLPRYYKLSGRIRFDLEDVIAFEQLHLVDAHAAETRPQI